MVSYDTIIAGGDLSLGSLATQKALADMRVAIDSNRFQPVCRKKNNDTLAKLGLTWADAKDAIYTLTEKEYRRGPFLDRDDPTSDHFWEFKKRVDGEVIYIKFKILYQEDGRVKLVSFHIDE